MQDSINVSHIQPRSFFHSEQAAQLLGPSKAIAELYRKVRHLAPHLRAILLSGPSDCGQEAAARLLLMFSAHPSRPFVTLQASDVEQFLDGVASTTGLSSVFLYIPAVEQLSILAQTQLVKHLKTLHSNQVTMVGASKEDLRTLVGMRVLLPEFATALGEVRIALPALRDRKEDLPMLLPHIVQIRCQSRQQNIPQLSKSFLDKVMEHDWPGNFAELSKVLDCMLDCKPTILDVPVWKRAVKVVRDFQPQTPRDEFTTLEIAIQEHVSSVLKACGGNKMHAAKILGVSRSKLYRFMGEGRSQSDVHPN